MSNRINNFLRRPMVGGLGTMTWGNFFILAIAFMACAQVQAAQANHASLLTPSIGQSGFPTVAEGIVAWIKTITGGGCAWSIYDKVGGGRDVGQTMKESALPITGAALVASPSILSYFIGSTTASSGSSSASLLNLLGSWNFTFS